MSRTDRSSVLYKLRRFQRIRLVGTYVLGALLVALSGTTTLGSGMLALQYRDFWFVITAIASFSVFMMLCMRLPKRTMRLRIAIASIKKQISDADDQV